MRSHRMLGFVGAGNALVALMLAASAGSAVAQDWQPVRSSGNAGLQVYADVVNGTWCQDSVGIKIVADDVRTFADGAIDDTLAEVGRKLAPSCPQMTGFQVFGHVAPDDRLVYHAIAAKEQAWEPMIGKAPTVQRVAVPASVSPSAGQVPGGATIAALISGNTLYGEVLPTTPARSAYVRQKMAQSAPDSAMYFSRNGTWVERQSREQRGRVREQFLTGKWSIQGDRLCLARGCFALGRSNDGSVVFIGADGKRYKRFDRFVPGDPENLVQGQVAYAQRVEESNRKAMALLGLFVGMAAMSDGGGGGGGGGGDADDLGKRELQRRLDKQMDKDLHPPPPTP